MPLDPEIKDKVTSYVEAHLPDEGWYASAFDYIKEEQLSRRLTDEFRAARHIYKLLEAIGANDWLQRAQIRVQVLQYASIYEAVIHHVLFVLLKDEEQVLKIREFPRLIPVDIPGHARSQLERYLAHDGKRLVPTFEGVGRTDETRVRFDAKAKCAASMGVISDDLRDDLIDLYEARNAIHIHAEIRKSIDYQLELSRKAYRRMQPLREQVGAFLSGRGL